MGTVPSPANRREINVFAGTVSKVAALTDDVSYSAALTDLGSVLLPLPGRAGLIARRYL